MTLLTAVWRSDPRKVAEDRGSWAGEGGNAAFMRRRSHRDALHRRAVAELGLLIRGPLAKRPLL